MSRVNIPKKMYERLLDKNANSCCVCKKTGVGLNLHHIDGDNSNTTDENLAVLCVNEHDAHHRPTKYPSLKHLDLSADKLKEYKDKWEEFVEECKKDNPDIIATINAFGTVESIIGMKVIFQYTSGEVVFERMYQMLDAPMDIWIDRAIKEVYRLSNTIKIALLDEPLIIEYCDNDNFSLSTVLDKPAALKVAKDDWLGKSLATVYINTEQPSLAITIFYDEELIFGVSMHRCKDMLHIMDYKTDELIKFKKVKSKRKQVMDKIEEILGQWEVGNIIYGTGDSENPTIISEIELPRCWEYQNCHD